MKQVKNVFGEKINIKIENDVVLIHHEDVSDDFITLNEIFKNNVLTLEELRLIYNSVKEIMNPNNPHISLFLI